MKYHLIGIITVICKYRNAIVIKMLQYCSGTGGTSALSVFALADDVSSFTVSTVNKFCQIISLREKSIICKTIFRKYLQVNVMYFNRKDTICFTRVIDRHIFFPLFLDSPDHKNWLTLHFPGNACQQFFSGFSWINFNSHWNPPEFSFSIPIFHSTSLQYNTKPHQMS